MQDIFKYQFLKEIIKLPFIEEVMLYGSRAREDATERSDIDIAITCNDATSHDWLKILDLTSKSDTLLKIDCIRLDELEETSKLKQNIYKYGKLIYSKEKQFMTKEYWKDSFESLGEAIARLREVLNKSSNRIEEAEIYRDAAIQRFEFSIELFWKILQKFLRYEKLEANTPREVLSKSYVAKLIDQEDVWLKMLDDRNLTSHMYKEALAKEIFARIKSYIPVLEITYKNLQERYKKL